MATKSSQEATSTEQIEELLDAVDKTLERLKTLYEQYFLGIQKQAPAFIHNDVERKLRDLTQLNIRNTGLRYRLATLQQKFGSYNSYWRRTMRQIENGTYTRNLAKIGREAARSGSDIPEEILAAMPKRMREQVLRDRDQALAMAKRRNQVEEPLADDEAALITDTPAPADRPVDKKTRSGAHVLEDEGDIDFNELFSAFDDDAPKADAIKPAVARTKSRSRPPTTRPQSMSRPPPLRMPVAGQVRAATPPPVERPANDTISQSGQPIAAITPVQRAVPRAATQPGSAVPSPVGAQPSGGVPRPVGAQPSGAVPQPVGAQPSGAVPHPVGAQPSGAIPRQGTGPAPAVTHPGVDQRGTGPVSAVRGTQPGADPRGTGPSPAVRAATQAGADRATGPVPAVAADRATGPMPAVPSAERPTVPVPRPVAPSQQSRPIPVMPGSASATGPVPVETMSGPFPRASSEKSGPTAQTGRTTGSIPRPPTAQPAKPAVPLKPPPGMTEADVNALHAKYVKAKEAVGEKVDAGSRDKLLKTINQTAPKIMEQYKASGVDFSVVVKDNQVIIKAKPKT